MASAAPTRVTVTRVIARDVTTSRGSASANTDGKVCKSFNITIYLVATNCCLSGLYRVLKLTG